MTISKRARLINFILRVSKIKQRLADFDAGMKFLARDRKHGPARPGKWFYKNRAVTESQINGHKIYHIDDGKSGSKQHLFYLHGGAYAFNIMFLHWSMIRRLINAVGASATVPLYPLTPEHDWSNSYPVVLEAFEKAAEKHGAENITIMGDSAGGGFSLGLCQMLRDLGKPLPGKIVLLSPWLDVTASDPLQEELEKKDLLLSIAGARNAGEFWAGEGNDPKSFPVSPLFASIDNLPPIAAFSGSHDLLYSDALRLKAKAGRRDIPVELYVAEGMQHVWMLLPIREAKKTFNQIVDFMTRKKD